MPVPCNVTVLVPPPPFAVPMMVEPVCRISETLPVPPLIAVPTLLCNRPALMIVVAHTKRANRGAIRTNDLTASEILNRCAETRQRVGKRRVGRRPATERPATDDDLVRIDQLIVVALQIGAIA